MNQTWENDKNQILGLTLAKICSPNFFCGFYFYYMLYIVAKYHCMEFKGNLLNQIWGNDKKASFGPDLGPLVPLAQI